MNYPIHLSWNQTGFLWFLKINHLPAGFSFVSQIKTEAPKLQTCEWLPVEKCHPHGDKMEPGQMLGWPANHEKLCRDGSSGMESHETKNGRIRNELLSNRKKDCLKTQKWFQSYCLNWWVWMQHACTSQVSTCSRNVDPLWHGRAEHLLSDSSAQTGLLQGCHFRTLPLQETLSLTFWSFS